MKIAKALAGERVKDKGEEGRQRIVMTCERRGTGAEEGRVDPTGEDAPHPPFPHMWAVVPRFDGGQRRSRRGGRRPQEQRGVPSPSSSSKPQGRCRPLLHHRCHRWNPRYIISASLRGLGQAEEQGGTRQEQHRAEHQEEGKTSRRKRGRSPRKELVARSAHLYCDSRSMVFAKPPGCL